ncbi:MAG: nucleotidyltransferase domain-containing protein [Anaerolineae bacterium]|nr:nucleotidyltransferase domain-containing protein [Anaerolineae bacterium]
MAALRGRPGSRDPKSSGEERRLREMVRRLVEAYRPDRVYLFGSRARGDSGPDSDYDVLVVVPDDAPPERGRSRLAYQVLWDVGVAADVLVWTRSALESRLHLRASLPAAVAKEGSVLYSTYPTRTHTGLDQARFPSAGALLCGSTGVSPSRRTRRW